MLAAPDPGQTEAVQETEAQGPRRGTLRVYLGAAPGVGKTFAMLDEGRRRRERGARVVIGAIETHGRSATIEQLRRLDHHGEGDSSMAQLNTDQIAALRPDVVLIDDMARPNPAQSNRSQRWQDVAMLLECGIDVITTLNIAELESVRDVAERITGLAPVGTVPDAFVRSAAQVELIDMAPEALRRRLAHGNVYPPGEVDAAMAESFGEPRLRALREMALLWVADGASSFDPSPDTGGGTDIGFGRRDTRERVVVAITGVPGGEIVIRRAARMAQRARASLVAVHVAPSSAIDGHAGPSLEAQQRLVRELGGSAQTVVGDDVAVALTAFARTERATQLVVGASGHGRVHHALRGSVTNELIRLGRDVDVHMVSLRGLALVDVGGGATASVKASKRTRDRRWSRVGLPRRRRLLAAFAAIVSIPFLTFVLVRLDDRMSLASQALVFLGLVVVIAAAGGIEVGLASMVASLVAINWFFTEPRHTLLVGDAEDIIALVVFGVVTLTVSALVSQAARQAREARRSRTEAEILARSSATAVGAAEPLAELVEQLRTFTGSTYARIEQRVPGSLVGAAESAAGRLEVALDEQRSLVLIGSPLSVEDRRLVAVFADQLRGALRTSDLAAAASAADRLQEANDFRTALLRAVSHDLRSPLAGIKAASSSLLSAEVTWEPDQQHDFLETIDAETDRLNRLIEELLEMSRLEAGVIVAQQVEADLATILDDAVRSLPLDVRDRVQIRVTVDAHRVRTDPALLERVVANLISNALNATAFSADPSRRIVSAEAERVGSAVLVRVIDRGPGIAAAQRDAARRPFQRLDDASHRDGMGLGLAIADGLARTIGAELDLDDTPGGGLTASVRLPCTLATTAAAVLNAATAPTEVPS